MSGLIAIIVNFNFYDSKLLYIGTPYTTFYFSQYRCKSCSYLEKESTKICSSRHKRDLI